MIVVHFRQHVDCVRVEGQIWAIDHTQRIQLVPQSTLAKYKLSGVGPIQAVDTVRTANPILYRGRLA
jgi:hypothetical protein